MAAAVLICCKSRRGQPLEQAIYAAALQ